MKSSESHHIVGIDGGGTGCRVAIADIDGRVISRSSGGPANFATDPVGTVKNVMSAVEDAAASAGFAPNALWQCATHIGLAGILDRADAARLAAAVPFQRVCVSDDRQTSMTGTLGGDDGILAAIGTGAFVGVRHGGADRFFGGWGLNLGDQASGAWLGRGALEVCLLVHDGLAEASDLTQVIGVEIGPDPASFVAYARQAKPSDYANFAPMIVEGAKAGDANARSLMQRGADYLNMCFHKANAPENTALCLTGGVGLHYAPYIATPYAARITTPKGTALAGAISLARLAHQNLEVSS